MDKLKKEIDECFRFAHKSAQISSDYFMGRFKDERLVKVFFDKSNPLMAQIQFGHFPGEYSDHVASELIPPPIPSQERDDLLKSKIINFILSDTKLRLEESLIMMYSSKNDKWKNFLEIGTGWAQMSGIMASAISERKDRSKCNLFTVDYNLASTIDGVANNFRQINAKSLISRLSYEDFWSHTDVGACEYFNTNKESLDFIFIDGDHSYDQSLLDWNNASSVLSKDGVITIHDLKIRTQGLTYPDVALRVFEEISHKDWVKYRLPTKHSLGLVHRRDASDETYAWVRDTFKKISCLYEPARYLEDIHLRDLIPSQVPMRNPWHNIINGISGLV